MRADLIRFGGCLALLALTSSAQAAVTRFDVTSKEPAAWGGKAFGDGGTVTRILGRATFALKPSDRRDAVIADIGSAPRNAKGMVEATTDVMILRPAKPNGVMILELPNRGGALILNFADDSQDFAAPLPAGGNRGFGLDKASDAGTGFLFDHGFTLVEVGWQGDIQPGHGVGLQAPVAKGVTGTSRDLWTFNDTEHTKRVTLSYPAAAPFKARLTQRDVPDAPAQVPAGMTFKFIDPNTVEITRPTGTKAGSVYELTYTARDPVVMGMGFAALRDVGSFLKYDASSANPIAASGQTGIRQAIATGVSQSGRALRDMLYNGFNEDEQGRRVFDGMLPLIPGARRSFTNARFAQPGRNPGPLLDRLYPVDQFPFTYGTQTDTLTGKSDGVLKRCAASNTCPRIIEMDSEFEFWGSHASLNVADAQGKAVPVPANVRLFLITGAQHGSSGNAVSRSNAMCALPSSPVRSTPLVRALILDLDAWVRNDTMPPDSRYPSVTDHTLVAPEDAYPAIPQLPYKAQYAKANWVEQTDDGPIVRGEYPIMVPKAGPDGNALAGVRLPIVAVPRATYTGWDPLLNSSSPEGLCTQAGGAVPFAATRALRLAAGDPRLSLEELYPTEDAYVGKVRKVADQLVADRLMLKEDADAAVKAAGEGKLAKLAPAAPAN